mgnify:CR=1 FL=1
MSAIEAIDIELVQISKQLKPLLDRQAALRTKRRELASMAFIEANAITKDDVELSSGDGKPYFTFVHQFVEWLRSKNKCKRFAEWNGTIYFTSDLLSRRMPGDRPARIEDLK